MNVAFDPARFEAQVAEVARLLAAEMRRARARTGPVLKRPTVDTILRELDFASAVADGGRELPALVARVIERSNHLHHPRYIGHQVAVPMWPSAVADLVHGILDNGMAVYEMGPAATAVERGIVRFMLGKVDATWAAEGDGVFVHGGSLGNLTALLAARVRVFPDAFRVGAPRGAVVLASEAAHYSIARAAGIMGLGADAVVPVACDDALRMRPDALEDAHRRVVAEGRAVVAVVANAGATPNGAFDPLRLIGTYCRAHDLYLHVDGAHGASALMSLRHAALADGLALADSVVWDTHKMLGTSTLACAVLFRERGRIARTFEQDAPYLLLPEEQAGPDLSKLTIECTKAPLAMKLFFTLAVVGERGLGEHVAHLFDRAARFHDLITARPGFTTFGRPQANILCFRYGTDPALMDAVRRDLVAEGRFYVTRTTLRGEAWLRLTVMNPFTDESDIVALLETVEAVARSRRT